MQKLYVASSNGQRVRALPNLTAPIVKVLPFNNPVYLEDDADLSIGDGGWHWRKLVDGSGYVAEHRVKGEVKVTVQTVEVIDRLLEFNPIKVE